MGGETKNRGFLLGVALVLLPGCYAAIGPSVGIVVPSGRPTIGWEVSAVSGAVGQVFAAGGPATDGHPAWTRRTYLVWEPRLGGVPGDSSILVGGGATFGARWDRSDGSSAPPRAAFISGIWGGAVVPFDRPTDYLSGRTLPYFSIALGVRGDEIYLAPKVGILQEPSFTLDLGGGFGH
jgi:hypothetical protein